LVTIYLTPVELRYATFVGRHRHKLYEQTRRGVDRTRCGNTGEQGRIMGACGELAVSKYLGTYWHPHIEESREQYDVAGGVEVRTTPHATGHLIVRQGVHRVTGLLYDKPNAPYVLAIQREPFTFWLPGWCYGQEGLKREYWRPNKYNLDWESYYVPQAQLRSMESLKDLLRRG